MCGGGGGGGGSGGGGGEDRALAAVLTTSSVFCSSLFIPGTPSSFEIEGGGLNYLFTPSTFSSQSISSRALDGE
jgi:hypothetical protein